MVRRLLKWVLVFALVMLGGLAPGAALAQKGAQNVSALIKKGQNFFDDQRYEESTQTLSAALLRPEITKEQRIAIYKLLAFNYILLDKKEEADGAVRGLLVTDETFELPKSESPRFVGFFADSRKRWVDDGKPGMKADGTTEKALPPVKLRHASPAQVRKGAEVALSGELDDPEGSVAAVRLFYRQGSSEKFASTKAKYAMRKFSVEIPSSSVRPPLVEYYLEAIDQNGLPVATRGDAELPLRIAVPESGGVLTSPWFWVPVSVAVVAAVVIPVVVIATRTPTADVTVTVTE